MCSIASLSTQLVFPLYYSGPVKYALLGDYDLDRTNDDAQPLRVDVSETIAHPQFKRTSKYFDIALVKLARRITFNQYIRPACLPETYETGTSKAIASGWGRTSARSEGSNVLMKVVLEIFNEEECNATYRVEATTSQLINGIIPDSQFCAGHHTEKKDTCQVSTNSVQQHKKLATIQTYFLFNRVIRAGPFKFIIHTTNACIPSLVSLRLVNCAENSTLQEYTLECMHIWIGLKVTFGHINEIDAEVSRIVSVEF